MGTWCPDTKQMLPKFVKILQHLNYDINNVNYYALNRKKLYINGTKPLNKVRYVPTIIIYKNKKELNRIVEYHVESVEADLLNILTSNTYKNALEN